MSYPTHVIIIRPISGKENELLAYCDVTIAYSREEAELIAKEICDGDEINEAVIVEINYSLRNE